MTVTANAYSSNNKKQLENLCKERDIKGISHKSKDELIAMLVANDVKATPTVPVVQPKEEAHDDASSTSSTRSQEYIFHANWVQVLPYLEDASISTIIADPASLAGGDRWISEGLRVLEPKGVFFIRGISRTPPCIPKHIHTTWHTSEKVLAIRKDIPHSSDATTPAELYTTHLGTTSADSKVLMPFSNNSETVKLVKKAQRPFIAMDAQSVDHLYNLL